MTSRTAIKIYKFRSADGGQCDVDMDHDHDAVEQPPPFPIFPLSDITTRMMSHGNRFGDTVAAPFEVNAKTCHQ